MAAFAGRTMLLKRGDGAMVEVFTTVGCFTTVTFSASSEAVEITCSDDAASLTTTLKKTLLPFAGISSVSVSANGVFKDQAVLFLIEDDLFEGSLNNYQIAFGNGDVYTGAFQITSLEYTGEFNGAQQYSISLESSGAVTVVRG